MTKSDLPFIPEFFDRYIELTDNRELSEQLADTRNAFEELLPRMHRLGDKVYAPGKWSAKEILQHIIDNERIQSCRALCMARGELQNLPGYDETSYGKASLANRRSLEDLHEEFLQVRNCSLLLFGSMNAGMLLRTGSAGERKLTPLALGLVLVGHQLHHMQILEQRYFPLV